MVETVRDIMSEELDVDGWTLEEIYARQRYVVGVLVDIAKRIEEVSTELPKAEAEFQAVYDRAFLASSLDSARDGWRVGMHEAYARQEAQEASLRRDLLRHEQKALTARRQIWLKAAELLQSRQVDARYAA